MLKVGLKDCIEGTMSEYKTLAENLRFIADEDILSILAYLSQHQSEQVSLQDLAAFVSISPTNLKEKYLDPLCEKGILQKYYLRDEVSTYAINRTNMDETFRLMKIIVNPS